MSSLVLYTRVSTVRQKQSGLGLEAQENAANNYAASVGGTFVGRFKEAESGKLADRPELKKALAMAKRLGATLVVAKLDRLSRNLAFLASLMESGVKFVCCDNPHATELTLGILAVIAQHEARMISERTKAALAVAKANGTRLGASAHKHRRDPSQMRASIRKAIDASARARTRAFREFAQPLLPTIQEWRQQGHGYTEIARRLNDEGHRTRFGSLWQHAQVQRILETKP